MFGENDPSVKIATASKAGLVPTPPNDATKYLDGTMNFSVPPGTGVPTSRNINTTAPITGGGNLTADRTIGISNATATTAGAVPTPPNDTKKFLRGDATFAQVDWTKLLNVDQITTVVYQVSSGTAGGTGTSGAWTKYPISGYLQNDLGLSAVSSNQWALPAGTYEVTGGALIFGDVGSVKWRFQNVTDSTTVVQSLTGNYNNITGPHYLPLVVPIGIKFTIASTKTFEIDYWMQSTTGGNNDLGFPWSNPGTVENYGFLTINKIG